MENVFKCKYQNGGLLNGGKCSVLTPHIHCPYHRSNHMICNQAIAEGEFHAHCGFKNFGRRPCTCDHIFTSEDRKQHIHCTHKGKSYEETMCGEFTHTHEHCARSGCNHTFKTLFICPPAGTSEGLINIYKNGYDAEKAMHIHCPIEGCPFLCEEYHTEGETCENCESHTHCSECDYLEPHTHCNFKYKNGERCGDHDTRYHGHCYGCEGIYDDGFCHNCH
jgi:hypothetical protein